MAYVEAISNGGSGTTAARANAIRSGYFARNRVVVSLNGAQRRGVEKAGLTISERVGSEPSTADLVLKGGGGYVPDRGHEVVIGHGTVDNRLFAGRLLRVHRRVARHSERRPTYELEAADYGALDLRAVTAAGLRVASLSGNSVIGALVSATTPSVASMGLTQAFVEPGLPTVAEFSVSPTEALADALDRLAETLGGQWYYDYRRQLHFWVTSDPQPRPTINTFSGTSPGFWNLTRTVDLSQVISRVVGLGASTRTAADVWSDERRIPIEGAEPIADGIITGDEGSSYRFSPTARVIIDGIPRSLVKVFDAVQLYANYKEAISSPSPMSLTANGYWVGGFTATYPQVGGWDYLLGREWWADGAYAWHVESVTTVSTTANTILRQFFVPSSGPGAPPPTAIGVLEVGNRLTTPEYFEMQVATLTVNSRYVIPKGTPVQAYYTAVNSSAYAQIQTLCNNTAYGWITGTVSGDYTPGDLVEACDAALEQGKPEYWQTLEFDTRNGDVTRGQRVYFSLTSPGEASGPTIAGSFTVQEVTISGFDQMADTLGPIRTAQARAVPRPTLWRMRRQSTG